MDRKKFFEYLLWSAGGMALTGMVITGGAIKKSRRDRRFIEIRGDMFPVDTNNIDSLQSAEEMSLFDSTTQRIVSEDTLNSKYMQPLETNIARAKYCDIVAQNAESLLPASKPYLETILKANYDYRTIFDLPVEYHIALLNQESLFNPNAISYAPAVGIAQFMRETAKGMKMKVYSASKFPELYEGEIKLKELNKTTNNLWNLVMNNLKSNNFDVMIQYKLDYDKAVTERKELTRKVHDLYIGAIDELDDERLDSALSIDNSARFLSELGRESKDEYDGRHAHSIMRLILAYNCGMGNVKKGEGLPFIQQSVQYLRKIMIMADKLAPKQRPALIYESNPQIFEMLTAKIYELEKVA